MAEREPRYGTGARIFHWLTLALVLVQIPAGIAMTGEGFEQATVDRLFILHKGMGVVLLLVILARVVWRLTHPAPPMPEHIPPLERRIAGLTHGAIYVLLVIMPVSGYVRTVGDGFPIELLDALGVPTFLPAMPELAKTMSIVHRFTIMALVGLVAVHVGEVLRHQLVERDGIMGRMWPPVAGKGTGKAGDPRADEEPAGEPAGV